MTGFLLYTFPTSPRLHVDNLLGLALEGKNSPHPIPVLGTPPDIPNSPIMIMQGQTIHVRRQDMRSRQSNHETHLPDPSQTTNAQPSTPSSPKANI